ncbi:MAG: hypothetical protein EXQ87_12690 [Alphaproteobacteria bacterium]|nr:hypothetical protein [Alphaproteobacteria bacterium]
MGFGDLFLRRRPRQGPADRLYAAVVAQARSPHLYTVCGVPDTLDGRFEAIVLHMFLVLHRLKTEGPRDDLHALGTALGERMIVDFDRNLREMGVGDLSVGRKVTFMAEATYGRIAAYDRGFSAGVEGLEAALRRNLYGTIAEPDPAGLALGQAYVRRVAGHLAAQSVDRIAAGDLDFGLPPTA